MRQVKIASKAAVILLVGLLASCGGGGGGGTAAPAPVSPVTPAVPAPPAPPPVTAAPLVIVALNVPNGSLAVDPRATFEFGTTRPMVPTFGADQVVLSDGTRTYPVKVEINFARLIITPVAGLPTRTSYRLTIKAGATNTDGSVLQSDFVLDFKTSIAVFEPKQLTAADNSVGFGDYPGIQVADVNGDGRPDLIELASLYRPDLFAAVGYRLNIYLQNATGGFDKLQSLEYIVQQKEYSNFDPQLIVLDIDGDHKPEVLVPEYHLGRPSESGIRIFKAGADGKYAAHDFIATSFAQNVQVVDLDGDGKMDLAGGDRATSTGGADGVQVLRGTATGFTKLPPIALPDGRAEFGFADLDQDGKRELIVNRRYTAPNFLPTTELLIYSQDATGVFSRNAALTAEAVGFCTNADYCREMKIADLNADGKPELIFSAQVGNGNTDNLVLVFTRQPGVGLVKVSQTSIGYDASVFAITDMDGDGLPDMFVVGAGFFSIVGGTRNYSWDFSNKFSPITSGTMHPLNVALADVDGNGQTDIVFDSANGGIVLARRIKF